MQFKARHCCRNPSFIHPRLTVVTVMGRSREQGISDILSSAAKLTLQTEVDFDVYISSSGHPQRKLKLLGRKHKEQSSNFLLSCKTYRQVPRADSSEGVLKFCSLCKYTGKEIKMSEKGLESCLKG